GWRSKPAKMAGSGTRGLPGLVVKTHYGLGMTLYELLTLKAAYVSGDRLKLIELIRSSEPASPRSVDARIPCDLETIVMKALDKDVRRRYQSADDLWEDLQRFVN